VDFVKLDVEGGEREVLEGASLVLTGFPLLSFAKCSMPRRRLGGYQAREIMLMLRRFDFEWFDICADGSLVAHEIRITTGTFETMSQYRKKSAPWVRISPR
jgi:hypothetical protein